MADIQIWVDADACPVVIREIIFRAAQRRQIKTTLVANQYIKTPPGDLITSSVVASGFDEADNAIVERCKADDIVITSDIPLASDVLAKGGHVITSRGERYTQNNIKQRLNMRDFMETMRASGEHTGGPPPLNQADRKQFADEFDRLLTKLTRKP